MNASAPARRSSARDERLDLARGLTMLIIFIVHVPANAWAEFIPAKMGFSSGAEAFVLCSGLACGIAFGGAFRREGWLAGSRRIGRRICQLWAAQVLAFLGFALMLLAADALFGAGRYSAQYDLGYLVSSPVTAVTQLATLIYVPIFFDILPLYILLLAAVPLMVLAARRSPWLALGLSGALWLGVQLWPLNLVAHPANGRLWYFDPFAWQFLFFIGFGVTSGWLKPPAATPTRIAAAAAFIIACIPLTFWAVHDVWPLMRTLYFAIYPNEAITTLHVLRLIHVLVLAWLFAALLAPWKERLAEGWPSPFVLIGQQTLVTFLTGIFLSALAGIVLDLTGRTIFTVTLINLTGFILLLAAAIAARRVKAAINTKRMETLTCSPAA